MGELEFIRYDKQYEDIAKLIETEMKSEMATTNVCTFDRKNSTLVKHNGSIVGYCAFIISRGIPTIQYGVLKKYRRMGYGSKILNTVTNEMFNSGYSRMELSISPQNEASIKMAEACGYYRSYDDDNDMYLTYYKNNYRKVR